MILELFLNQGFFKTHLYNISLLAPSVGLASPDDFQDRGVWKGILAEPLLLEQPFFPKKSVPVLDHSQPKP